MGNRQSAEDDTEDTERYNYSDGERNDPADDELLTSSGTGKKRKLENPDGNPDSKRLANVVNSSGASAGPSTTSSPGASAGPSTTSSPGASAGPSTTSSPGASAGPSTTSSPGASAGPSRSSPGASAGPSTTGSRAGPSVTKPYLEVSAGTEDSIAEALACHICHEIIHDCISLQPCMHSYCAGCYSGWMVTSNKCPACSREVERISRNYMLSAVVEAYFRNHPEKRRPLKDMQDLDTMNKITRDMLHPGRERHGDDDYYDDDEDDDDDYYDDWDDDDDDDDYYDDSDDDDDDYYDDWDDYDDDDDDYYDDWDDDDDDWDDGDDDYYEYEDNDDDSVEVYCQYSVPQPVN